MNDFLALIAYLLVWSRAVALNWVEELGLGKVLKGCVVGSRSPGFTPKLGGDGVVLFIHRVFTWALCVSFLLKLLFLLVLLD